MGSLAPTLRERWAESSLQLDCRSSLDVTFNSSFWLIFFAVCLRHVVEVLNMVVMRTEYQSKTLQVYYLSSVSFCVYLIFLRVSFVPVIKKLRQ